MADRDKGWRRWFWLAYWTLWRLLVKGEPRPAYCQNPSCGAWTWCREQQLNRSTATAMMCFECADEEQKEVEAAWQEYWSGML